MKQIIQSLKTGSIQIVDVPSPKVTDETLLIKTSKTLISSGTERMLLEFGKANLVNKARQQPDKVKIFIDKIKTDGIKPTVKTVFNKLDQPLSLGYCNVGIIEKVGNNIKGLKKGDRVISNGNHAEVVNVPINLCAKVPETLSDEEASFTVLASVALQGVRLVKPTLGEAIAVFGLGLVGLITVQILRANGCRVLALDFDKKKLDLAKDFGADVADLNSEDPIMSAEIFSRGRGVDASIIATATKSNNPIHQATLMSRKRARVVLVGVAGLKISREDFYKKEILFQVSSSYGPGRYDLNYEEKSNDYPISYIRWTAQRNFEAVLDLMSSGDINVKPLISHKFDINDANKAYELIISKKFSLGILIDYPEVNPTKINEKVTLKKDEETQNYKVINNQKIKVSFIGSGNYATSILIPSFKSCGSKLISIASKTGVSATYSGKKFGFYESTTDADSLFHDDANDAIVIATRHNNHSNFILKGINSNKHLFIEKPLCLNLMELEQIKSKYTGSKVLMVGFNRRFAPQTKKIKNLLSNVSEPKSILMTINAGHIPKDHWTQNKDIGGGRIIGEVCHFIDLLRFLIGEPIIKHQIHYMNSITKDTAIIQLTFKDGSIGSIHYLANGSKSFPKERLEIFSGGRVLQLDNFKKLRGYGWPRFKKMNLWYQDKGQKECVKSFIDSISNGGPSPIPIEEIFEVSRVTIELSHQQF